MAQAEIPYQESMELHHPHSWVTKYWYSQDHKVIAVQYGITAMAVGLVALVLSWIMRMQIGFPRPARRGVSHRTSTTSPSPCTA